MKPNKNLHMIAYFLLILGGLNWLLLGIFGWEIGYIFGGSSSFISKLIYILIGLAAIYELATYNKKQTPEIGDNHQDSA